MSFEGGVALTAAVAGLVALITVPALLVVDESGQIGQPGQIGAIDLDRRGASVTGSSPIRARTGRVEARVKRARESTDPGDAPDPSNRGRAAAESGQPPVIGEPPPVDPQVSPGRQPPAAKSPPPADVEVSAATDDDDAGAGLEPSDGDE